MPLKVFVDSDVVISALLSSTGAAYVLLNNSYSTCFISNLSLAELKIVIKRLKIDSAKLDHLIKNQFQVIKLNKQLNQIKSEFGIYTLDPNDSHVIYGAQQAKATFLISYNLKHFKLDKIKQDFDIIATTPGNFLQYLRSQI